MKVIKFKISKLRVPIEEVSHGLTHDLYALVVKIIAFFLF
jgi:hypothetical protein